MLQDKIASIVKKSITASMEAGDLGELTELPDTIAVDLTKSPEHGDRAISIAMKIAKDAKLAPRAIAESIVANLPETSFSKIDIAGPGFINLTLNWDMLEDLIAEIHSLDQDYGRISHDNKPDKSYSKVLIEYVSANPTGDLHLGHGRQAVLGSAMAELLKWGGYEVSTEFYINDAGVQMEKLAHSCRQSIFIQEGLIPKSEYDGINNYPLDSMLEFIRPDKYQSFLEEHTHHIKSKEPDEFHACLTRVPDQSYGYLAEQIFIEAQHEILTKVGTKFDLWYSERENLYQRTDAEFHNKVTETCQKLADTGHSYEEEGALWFKAKDFGDERNRVLKKSDGKYTYLAADYAYHLDKISRGFDKLINLWGADHHGQIPGMKGGLEALGSDPEILEIVLIQMVSLSKAGEEVKMSKRSGDIVTVKELVEEVGVDAFRYFLVESQANNRIVFDLELAKKQDKDNPVYYIQYAHARSCSILRNLYSQQVDQESINGNKTAAPVIDEAELNTWLEDFKSNKDLFNEVFQNLSIEELNSTKALILALASFPDEIKEAAQIKAPYKIANYLKNLATLFHQFYTHNRVITDNKRLMQARVSLVAASQKTLRNALTILGINTPERM